MINTYFMKNNNKYGGKKDKNMHTIKLVTSDKNSTAVTFASGSLGVAFPAKDYLQRDLKRLTP